MTANAATSDGIFVYAPTGLDVAAGDAVHLAGTVSEFFGMTELTATADAVCARRGAPRRDRRSPSRWPRPTSTSRSRACA